MYSKILVAVDGSENALRAVREAVRLAAGNPAAQITLITVVPPVDMFFGYGEIWLTVRQETRQKALEKLMQKAAEVLDQAKQAAEMAADAAGQVETVIQIGDPAQAIVEYAGKEGYEVIVMGRRGTGLLQELLLGSVSHKVMQLAPCPVLLVR